MPNSDFFFFKSDGKNETKFNKKKNWIYNGFSMYLKWALKSNSTIKLKTGQRKR